VRDRESEIVEQRQFGPRERHRTDSQRQTRERRADASDVDGVPVPAADDEHRSPHQSHSQSLPAAGPDDRRSREEADKRDD
jgi:hypothetical protein